MKTFSPTRILCFATIAAGLLAISSAQAVQPGVNLLVNGNAEAGAFSATGAPVAVPGWTTSSAFTVVNYKPADDTSGFPKVTDPGPPDRANQFFAGGNAATSTATQTIDVSANAADIDTGKAFVDLSGWVGGFGTDNDSASVNVAFFNGNTHLRGEVTEDGQAILLKDGHGRHVSTYDHLKAWDATGRALAARMQVRGREVSLEVDDAGASYPVTIDPDITQEVKLVAPDGAAEDHFGDSLAISGDTAIVAASGRGAVYIFVRKNATWEFQQTLFTGFAQSVAISGNTAIVGTTAVDSSRGAVLVFTRQGPRWSQQDVLTASDRAANDGFGYSVGISGDMAVVGAPYKDNQRGAAYVFVRSGNTWSPSQRLPVNDRNPDPRPEFNQDAFGYSVGISGETVIVGAPNDNPVGDTLQIEGSVYVYVRSGTMWAEQAFLTAPNTTALGFSVAISGDTALVGALFEEAYIFERSGTPPTWSPGQRLVPNPGEAVTYDQYGRSVAISGQRAIVGASDSDGGRGAAYVFQRNGGTWAEEQKLRASDATPGGGGVQSNFGSSVAVSGLTALIGAPLKQVGTNLRQGEAYVYPPLDSDGDGIPDAWEINGVTIDGVYINLPAMGADPMHKDLFIHAEWLQPNPSPGPPPGIIKPDPAAIKIVSDAFLRAPVTNPDGKPGIRLHVDAGPNSIMNPLTKETWGSLSRTGADDLPFQAATGSFIVVGGQSYYNWSAIDAIKEMHFKLAKRSAVFHYVLFCNTYGNSDSSGLSRGIGAADFIVATGQIGGGSVEQQAGTFMHEFGHNLGLLHGGDENVNKKPNYLSIMNYSFQLIGLINSSNKPPRSFDYSRRVLDPLNESALDENVGINDPDGHLTLWMCPRPQDTANLRYYRKFFPSKALDWNLNGVRDAAPVSADINCDTTMTLLSGFNDWPALVFDGGGKIGNPAGASEPDLMNTFNDEPAIDDILSIVPQDLLDEEALAPLDVVTTQAGGSPFEVIFDGSASTAVNGTIVSWEWDFGDGTTGTGATVTHTYTAAGEYFVTLTVTDSNGHVNLVPLLNVVTVPNSPSPTPTPTATPTPTPTATPTATPGNKPNLTPYQPPGWGDKLVVSNIKGTNTDSSPLIATDTLYIDFAVINNGDVGIFTSFRNKLYVDEVLMGTFVTNPPLNPSGYFYVEDFSIGLLSAGQHAIKIVADANGEIAESDETDNQYSKVINVMPAPISISATYTVTNTSDSGPGSLRQALLDANSHPNAAGSIDQIVFNLPDPGVQTITPSTALPQITEAVLIDGYTQPGASANSLAIGDNAVQRVELNLANLAGPNGLDLGGGGSIVRGLVINRFGFGGIVMRSNNNAIEGCFIGTNAAGDTAVPLTGPNRIQAAGIYVYQGSDNRIGGTNPASRNVIVGTGLGIVIGNDFLNGVANTLIQGNYIGTNADGTAALNNLDPVNAQGLSGSGIYASGSKISNTTIGGTQPGAGNLISGNGPPGDNGLTIRGIVISGADAFNPIGDVTIQGNLIGTNAAGTAAIPNSNGGIFVTQAVTRLLIGGPTAAARNVISGNGTAVQSGGNLNDIYLPAGLKIYADTTNGISVQGNYIGTGSDGVTLLPNRLNGIEIRPVVGKSYTIGGTNPGEGNVIAGTAQINGIVGHGVQVVRNPFVDTYGTVSILGNSIFANEGLGIDLVGYPENAFGVTANHTGGAGIGPNNLQNYPVLGSVSFSGGNITIEGTLNSVANKTYRVELFANNAPDPSRFGEGQFYLGFTSVTTDASGNAAFKVTFSAPAGAQYASATATDPDGNTSEFAAVPGQLLNISTRLRVQTGDNALIGGFIITGSEAKKVIIRGMGPSSGVQGYLADPTLELHDSSGILATNDNWKDTQEAEIRATGIPPSNDLEAAIVRTLNPGAYTAILRGKNDTTGIGLVEAYDLSQAAASRLANISTRGFVDTGDNVMIGGFIVGPDYTGFNSTGPAGAGAAKILVRGIGPSLSNAGITNALQDPMLELHDADGSIRASNDNWKDTQQAEIQATTIPPSNNAESAILATLPPGNYTAIVRGKNNTTGVGLVEVYNLQ